MYDLLVTRQFERDFRRLRNLNVQSRVRRKVQELKRRPELGRMLVGIEDPSFGRLFRPRVGDYRIVYAVSRRENRIILVSVAHRRKGYS